MVQEIAPHQPAHPLPGAHVTCHRKEQHINCSINKGIFPDELKIAKVIPIYKSGDKTSIKNYRPISVFEKIVYNHLINFINKHNILYKYQFGFRKRHSTNHAITTLVDKVSNALDVEML